MHKERSTQLYSIKYKAIAILTSLILLIGVFPVANVCADDAKDDSINITMIDEDTFIINDSGKSIKAKVYPSKVELYDNNVLQEYFLITDEGVYSSVTEVLIPYADIYDSNDGNNVKKSPTTPSPGSSKNIKISYAKIKGYLGDQATVYGVAGAIIAILAASGYSCPAMFGVAVSMVAVISDISSKVVKGSKSHGLTVRMKPYYRQVKGSKMIAWKFIKITTY